MKYVILMFILLSCSQAEIPPSPDIEESPRLGKKVELWATFYYSPVFKSDSKGYSLRDKNGYVLGPKLSLDKFCSLALQGSGIVDGKVYNFSTVNSKNAVPCGKSFLGWKYNSSGRVKFSLDNTEYGHGNKSEPLIPYKTLACDQSIYKYGQKFYIPVSESKENPTGLWKCIDVGGAIKGNHVDIFIGPVDMTREFKKGYKQAYSIMPFKEWVKSKSTHTFEAYLVE